MINTKVKKYIIALLLIVCLITLIVVIVIINKDKPDVTYDDEFVQNSIKEEVELKSGKVTTVSSISEYELARVCLNKFYIYYYNIFDENIINAEGEFDLNYYKEQLYNFLSKDYINRHEITIDNIDKKLEKIGNLKCEIYNIYLLTEFNNTKAYFISGILRDSNDSQNNKEFEITLYIDDSIHAYEVSLDNELGKEYKTLKDLEEVEFALPETVENRGMNVYSYPKSTYDTFAENQFDNIRNLLLYNVDLAYNMLSDDDKSKFGSVDGLKQYVDNNIRDVRLMSYKMYELNLEEDKFNIILYDDVPKFIFTCYCNDFSTLKFSIEEI